MWCLAGVVQAGVQFILFAGLLFVLLSADSDPLLYAVRVLPLSRSSQRQAASAFSNAMRGVFLCALKVRILDRYHLCSAGATELSVMLCWPGHCYQASLKQSVC